jgi:hypothetical protein
VYTATLTGGATAIRDTAGNPYGGSTWTFTTTPPPDTTAPRVSSTNPTAGSITAVATTNVTVTFSEPVTGVSAGNFYLTDATTGPVTTAFTGSGTTYTLDPTTDLTPGATYTANLGAGITDAAGNALAPTGWLFTVSATPADTSRPTVTAVTPANGRTGFSRTGNATAAFSETVTNVNATTFTLVRVSDGAPVTAREVRFNVTDNRWVFDPSPTLDANTQYRATITTGVMDPAGNHLAADYTWVFTTGA